VMLTPIFKKMDVILSLLTSIFQKSILFLHLLTSILIKKKTYCIFYIYLIFFVLSSHSHSHSHSQPYLSTLTHNYPQWRQGHERLAFSLFNSFVLFRFTKGEVTRLDNVSIEPGWDLVIAWLESCCNKKD